MRIFLLWLLGQTLLLLLRAVANALLNRPSPRLSGTNPLAWVRAAGEGRWLLCWVWFVLALHMPDLGKLLGSGRVLFPWPVPLLWGECCPAGWYEPSEPEGVAFLSGQVSQCILAQVLCVSDPGVVTVVVGLALV